MRPGNYLDADYLSDLRRCGSAGVRGGFDGRDVTAEKSSNITAADFFPADQSHIGRFERCVGSFEQGAHPFAFDHSYCLLRHIFSFVVERPGGAAPDSILLRRFGSGGRHKDFQQVLMRPR